VQSEIITGRLKGQEAEKMRNAVRGELLTDEKGNPTGFIPGYTQEVENLRFRYRDLQAERALQKEQTANLQPKPGRAKRSRRESARELAKIIQEQAKIQEAKDLEEQKKRAQDPEYLKQQEKERELKRKLDRER
jgi:hypothetical protein